MRDPNGAGKSALLHLCAGLLPVGWPERRAGIPRGRPGRRSRHSHCHDGGRHGVGEAWAVTAWRELRLFAGDAVLVASHYRTALVFEGGTSSPDRPREFVSG